MATAKNVSTENKVNIVTNIENNVTITQPSIQAVEITTGPQGKKGDTGAQGPQGDPASTGSLVTTGSVSNNILTFTKGDSSTFTLTVNTGSTVAAAGNDQEIQFNSGSSFSGDSKFKFVYASQSLEQGRGTTRATGLGSHAQGSTTLASGNDSHAEGRLTNAAGLYSHAQGEETMALGRASFVAGDINTASAAYSFVIGNQNKETHGQWGFVAGYGNTSTEDAKYSTVLGYQSHVLGWAAVAMGRKTSASFYGLANGDETYAAFAAHAEGKFTKANSRYTHTEGVSTTAGGRFVRLFTASATEPTSNWGDLDPGSAINDGDVWYNTNNSLLYAYSGSPSGVFVSQNTTPVEIISFNTSSGIYSFFTGSAAFGNGDIFPPSSGSNILAARHQYNSGKYSHAEGVFTTTYARNSHAEGKSTVASGFASHAEGFATRTGIENNYYAQLEGESGSYAHAEGYQTQAVGVASHAEGLGSRALGNYSHAEGLVTIALGDYQHTMGRYNHPNTHSLVIIGNGQNSSVTSSLIEFNRDGIIINEPITGSTFNVEANTIISDNSDTELLRVTQTGTGDAIRIEDSGNPDSTPTVITNTGNVLIGTGSGAPANNKLYIKGGDAGSLSVSSGNTVVIESNTTNYLGLFAPDASFSGIVMGSPSDTFGAFIRWQHNSGQLRIGAAKTNHSIGFSVGNKSATSMQLTPDVASTSNYNATLTVTGSIVTDNMSVSSNISASGNITGLTGSFGRLEGLSPITVGDDTIFTKNITVLGTASISVLHTTYESSSIIYTSGSTKFGDTMDDTHIRTGSLFITGSTTVVGGTYTGDGSGLTNIPAAGIVGLNLSQIASGSYSASISQNGSFSTNAVITGSGAGLTNIPASGITGLNLSRIASGSVTASISPNKGFEVNTNITSSGNISSSGQGIFGGVIVTDSNYDANGTAKYRVDGYSVLQNNGTTLKIAGNNYWETITYGNEDTDRHSFIGQITASGNVSSSAVSTASFGTYLGDGSQLSGISTTPFPFSGSATITGSLIVSGSTIDLSGASSVILPTATVPLINPKVEYVTAVAITSSGTEITLPNNLTYVSSSVYEYLEVFVNGLRLRYNVDFLPFTTSSVKYNIAIPAGSEVTYKSIKQTT